MGRCNANNFQQKLIFGSNGSKFYDSITSINKPKMTYQFQVSPTQTLAWRREWSFMLLADEVAPAVGYANQVWKNIIKKRAEMEIQKWSGN
jgi:hypothetical protein